jgi:hypothetical protein
MDHFCGEEEQSKIAENEDVVEAKHTYVLVL